MKKNDDTTKSTSSEEEVNVAYGAEDDSQASASQTNVSDEAGHLLSLQDTDFKLLKLTKQFDELPHRKKILELRAKIREVEGKLEQVTSLRVENSLALRRLQDDEERITAHRKEVQDKINASANYKQTAALTQEMESFVKKSGETETAILKQMEKLDKISGVEAQASSTLKKLTEQEAGVVEEFKKQGGALKNAIAHETKVREILAGRVSGPLYTRYEKARIAKGGIGAAYIEDDHCSACRMPYSEGQAVALKNSGPLADCPHCHRILITKRQTDLA